MYLSSPLHVALTPQYFPTLSPSPGSVSFVRGLGGLSGRFQQPSNATSVPRPPTHPLGRCRVEARAWGR